MLLKKSMRKKSFRALVMMTPFVLSGCSSVPDAANPVEWYRSSVEYFTEDEPQETAPALEQTDDGPAPVTATDTTDPVPAPDVVAPQIAEGFVAPNRNPAEYAQPVARQGAVVNPLGTQVVQNQPPAPLAAPTTRVETRSVGAAPAAPAPVRTVPVQTSPAQVPGSVNQTVQQRLDPAASQRDNRSLSEIFASNVSQTRPTDTGTLLRSPQSVNIGGHSFDTVVVSSSGVAREQPRLSDFQNQTAGQQFASLNTTIQSDVRNNSVLMGLEPRLVRDGRAKSLSVHNTLQYAGSFQVATIQFGNGSYNLTAEDQRILREVLAIHQQQGGVVRVVGHASSRTRDMSPDEHRRVNLQVSLARADIVGAQLLRLGVPSQNLYVGGVSDNLPLYQEVMPSGEAGNRRTEIFIDY